MMTFRQFYDEVAALVPDRSFALDLEVWRHYHKGDATTPDRAEAEVTFSIYTCVPGDPGAAGQRFQGPSPEVALDALRAYLAGQEPAARGDEGLKAIDALGAPEVAF